MVFSGSVSDWIPKHLFDKGASKKRIPKQKKAEPGVSILKKDSGKDLHCLVILKKNRFCSMSFSGEVGSLVATILPEISFLQIGTSRSMTLIGCVGKGRTKSSVRISWQDLYILGPA